MTPSDFKPILEHLKDDVFNNCYFAVVFEEQISILNCKTHLVNFKATDKDDLCVQVDNYKRVTFTNGAIVDISISSYFG